MRLKKKLWSWLLVVLVVASLAGCQGDSSGGRRGAQVLNYNLGGEPATLDPAVATSSPDLTIINALFEGLVRLDENLAPQPAMAASWESLDGGTRYLFTLRRGIRWTKGDPVTAGDFEYAWKRALDPGTASEYAYLLFYLKKAEDFNRGKATADQVGVKALDDRTLEVVLEAPVPYFLSLTASPVYFPLDRKAVEQAGHKWGKEAGVMVTNGPFHLVRWAHGERMVLEPLNGYWDHPKVKLERLEVHMVPEASQELAMYRSGQLDILDNPPPSEISRLRETGSLKVPPVLATYFYQFNVEREPFDDPRIRRAFALAIDRQALVENVTRGGQTPALALIPYGFSNPATGKDFREEKPAYFKDASWEEAQQLLRDAGYPGGKGLPPVTITFNHGEAHRALAEAIRQMWQEKLGAEVRLEERDFETHVKENRKGNFQVSRLGWGADYYDPMSFLDRWTTGSGLNDGNWSSYRFDELVGEARKAADPGTRFELMHRAEDILMQETPLIPLFFYTDPYSVKDYVRGIYKLPLGADWEFKGAHLVK